MENHQNPHHPVRRFFLKLSAILLGIIALYMLVIAVGLWLNRWYGDQTQQPAEPIQTVSSSIIVLPHHDLLLEEFPRFYQSVVTDQKINSIILLSPNHYQPLSTMVKTTEHDFILEQTQVSVKKNIFTQPSTTVKVDNEVFDQEHGVLIHLPFIDQYFPEAQVIPLLLTRKILQKDLQALITTLAPLMTEDTLLLISTDFSHDLPFEEAQQKDNETMKLIQENNTEALLTLDDQYLDCPACLYVAMQLKSMQTGKPEVLYHNNSFNYLSLTDHDPTTSYFVLRW